MPWTGLNCWIHGLSFHRIQVTSADAAVAYVEHNLARLGLCSSDSLHATELCEGKINYVYCVCCRPQTQVHGNRAEETVCFVLKYAPPYVKCMGEGNLSLDQGRLGVEAAAMARVHALCPQHCPRLMLHDAPAFVIIQEYLSSHIKLTMAIHR
jgi:5-methylthioribose kinase